MTMLTKRILTERGLYIFLILMFVINIGGLVISYYNSRQLKANQAQIFCITRGFVDSTNYIQDNRIRTIKPFIDKCVEDK